VKISKRQGKYDGRQIKRAILLEVITDAVMIWLPVDLIYLYFAKGWSEPNTIILRVELVVLFLLPMFGIWRVYAFIKANGKKARTQSRMGK